MIRTCLHLKQFLSNFFAKNVTKAALFSVISEQNSSTFSWKRWCSTRCFCFVSRSHPECRILYCTTHFLEVQRDAPPAKTWFIHSRLLGEGLNLITTLKVIKNNQEADPSSCRSRIRSNREFLTERWILWGVQGSLQPSATQMLQEFHPPTTQRRLFFDSPACHDSPV